MIKYEDVKDRVQNALDTADTETKLTDTGVIGVVDYSLPSFQHRLFVFDAAKALVASYLVAHGAGSADPADISKAVFFSNVDNSHCSCLGVLQTGDRYIGKHGRSMRLIGLSDSNDAVERRDIVLHGSYYVNDKLADIPRIGRSWGCLAVDMTKIDEIMDKLDKHLIVTIYK